LRINTAIHVEQAEVALFQTTKEHRNHSSADFAKPGNQLL